MKKIEILENRIKVTTVFNEPSLTQQQFKDMCDIKKIMKKYHQTGQITHLNSNPMIYTDLTQIPDYQESLNKIIEAKNSFMTLSSEVRKRFNNNPQELINFLMDPNNKLEAQKLNLIRKDYINDDSTTNPNPTNQVKKPEDSNSTGPSQHTQN